MARYFVPISKEDLETKIIEAILKSDSAEPIEVEDEDGDEMPITTVEQFRDAARQEDDYYHSDEIDFFGMVEGFKDLTPEITKDLAKVEFDSENMCMRKCELEDGSGYYAEQGSQEIIGINTLPNGLTYLGVFAGGDWEGPIFYIIYWDGKKLRAYIPKKGNPWNNNTKSAFGNDDDNDEDAFREQLRKMDSPEDIDDVDFDAGLLFDTKLIIDDITKRIVLDEKFATKPKKKKVVKDKETGKDVEVEEEETNFIL